jgi:hypothetical protein
MPVEQQVEAIGRAYVNATDRGRAWADVVALLGKNSAKLKEVLTELGTKGFKVLDEENPLKISDADLERLDHAKDFWAKIGREIKTISAMAVARPGDALKALSGGPAGMGDLLAGGFDGKKGSESASESGGAEADKSKVAAIQKQLEATIQSSPQMIAAHKALEKAIDDEGRAYETSAQAAARLRQQAEEAEGQAEKLKSNRFDAESQLTAVKLQTEAAQFRQQANAEDAKAARERAQHQAAETEMAQKMLQANTMLMPIDVQLTQARAHSADLAKQLNALDTTSLTYRTDLLKVEGLILENRKEVSVLEEKSSIANVERIIKDQELRNRREAIALAAIEHDQNLTDAEKWEQKRIILTKAVEQQERYVRNMEAISANPGTPQAARDKAANAAGSGKNTASSTTEEIGAMGASPHSFLDNFKADLTSLSSQWGTFQKQMAGGLTGQISSAVNSVSRGIQGWLSHSMTFKQGITSIWTGFAQSAEQAFSDMIAKYLVSKMVMFAIDQAMAAKGLLLSAASAAKSLIMWIPSAIAASISSYGLAAAIGAAAVIGIIAAGGFEEGGHTGYGRDGEFAGSVHKNEFVWSAPAVRAIGVGNLERAHQAALGGGGGAASGGGMSGASGNIILAMSSEDVARSQRKHVDARVVRMAGKTPKARVAL